MFTSNTAYICRKKEVISVTGLSSSTIDRLEKQGKFPRRLKISPHLVGWKSNEIQEFLRNLPRADEISGDQIDFTDLKRTLGESHES